MNREDLIENWVRAYNDVQHAIELSFYEARSMLIGVDNAEIAEDTELMKGKELDF